MSSIPFRSKLPITLFLSILVIVLNQLNCKNNYQSPDQNEAVAEATSTIPNGSSLEPGNDPLYSFNDVSLSDSLDLNFRKKKKPLSKHQRKRPLVLFVGFDGITWKVLKPLLKQGQLKNFKRLCQTGSYGILQTDVGLSPVSWTSITTGMDKEQHGIYGEDVWERIYLKNVYHIWDILAAQGWKTGILGYPFLHEKYIPKGAFFMENKKAVPADILKDFHIDEFSDLESKFESSADKVYLMLKEEYDICFTLFQFTDLVQHAAYQHFRVDQSIGTNKLETKDSIKKIIKSGSADVIENYKIADRIVGRLFDLEPDYLFIMSDHGFKNVSIDFSVFLSPAMIDELGKLSDHNDFFSFWGQTNFENNSVRLFENDNRKAAIRNHPVYHAVPWANSSDGKPLASARISTIRWVIDYSNERAPNKFFTILENIRERKCNGLPCFNVKVKNNAAFIDISPEVLNRIKEMDLKWDHLTVVQRNGDHGPSDHGVVIMTGPGIKPGFELRNAGLHDLVPTLLYLLGYPVAKDMAGKVLSEAIQPDYLKSNPIQKIETYGRPDIQKMINHKLSLPERQRLEALGYLAR